MLSGRGMRGNYREILGVVKRSVIYFSLFSVKKWSFELSARLLIVFYQRLKDETKTFLCCIFFSLVIIGFCILTGVNNSY